MGYKIYKAILICTLLVVSAGAIYDGFLMIIDSSGNAINISTELLANTIFSDFLIPGSVLFLFVGIGSLFISYVLFVEPFPEIFTRIKVLKNLHFAWNLCLFHGLFFFLWIIIQILTIRIFNLLQVAALVSAFIMVTFPLLVSSLKSGSRQHVGMHY